MEALKQEIEMYPKEWNDELTDMVKQLLRELWSREKDLAVFSMDRVGQMLESEHAEEGLSPECIESLARCKDLYGQLLFAIEAAGITDPLVNSMRELSQWHPSRAGTNEDTDTNPEEKGDKFLSKDKLSAFVGEEIDNVESWLKDQVSESPSSEELVPIVPVEEAGAAALEVSHGNISLASPVETFETEEPFDATDTSEFEIPNINPESGPSILRVVPGGEGMEPEEDASKEMPLMPPVLPVQPPKLPPVQALSEKTELYLSLASYFHGLAAEDSPVVSKEMATRLQSQNLCFAVDAETERTTQRAFGKFVATKEAALRKVLIETGARFELRPEIRERLETLMNQHKNLLWEGNLPWATMRQALRFLCAVPAEKIEQPALIDAATLLLLFGEGPSETPNALNVTGLSSPEMVELCLRLFRLQKLRNRSLNAVGEWNQDELKLIEEDVSTILDQLKKIHFEATQD